MVIISGIKKENQEYLYYTLIYGNNSFHYWLPKNVSPYHSPVREIFHPFMYEDIEVQKDK